jgi:uroporphyrinogen-III decarboxylase
MSYADGWAAMQLEMPPRVPRFEADAHVHWKLVEAVTGIAVGPASPWETQRAAGLAFMQAWNYDLMLDALIGGAELNQLRTNMGHAVYAAGGVDYDPNVHCPFETPEQVLAFDPWEVYGPRDRADLTQRFEEHYAALCADRPWLVNMTGVYISLITGLTYVFGWERLLEAAGLDPEGFGEVLTRYATWIQQYYDALAETSVPVIYSHDDMVWTSGAIFHPEWYRRYVFPNYRRLCAPLVESGKRVIFVCDGDYTGFVDDIAACGVHGFFFEPLTSLECLVERYGQTHVLIGNVDTRTLLSGPRSAIRAEVERCLALGKGCPGFFLSVSNMIPPNTPVANALCYNEVYEELCRR